MIENNNSFLSTKLDHFSLWKKERKIAFVFSLLIISVTVSLIVNSMIKNRPEFVVDKFYFISFSNYFQNFSVFFYLTYQSNLLYGIVLLSFVLNATERKFQILFVFTVILTIVLVIFWTLIAWNLNMNFLTFIKTSTVHLVNPILSIFVLFWFRKEFQINKLGLSFSVIYSVCYYLFCFLLYFFTIRQWIAPEFKNNDIIAEKGIIFFYTGLTVYPFMNFIHPFFYSGDNNSIVILLNLIIVLSVICLPYLLSIFYINIFGIKAVNWRVLREIKLSFQRFRSFFWVSKPKK
ncbi:MAGa3780 family membrane protein [Mesomycoplasma flocculare]|uniref:Transmembrane protein n=2 Tax=Mesomycoplasma flocculare TaxID=2128 RepID=A0A0A8E8D1_MESFC|nr:hypothetical protein [Mesomycoplasma flocculare]AJC49867.1 hypothetical protein MYF_01765 [Mesomycoplasma flocculare ATCC 27399]ENX51204.1 hypothetical protein MFC_00704 [Mesomycoplasma flocculare ATCC 27716]